MASSLCFNHAEECPNNTNPDLPVRSETLTLNQRQQCADTTLLEGMNITTTVSCGGRQDNLITHAPE